MRTTITICMGSSCFARGNQKNLAAIEAFCEERGLGDQVELVGSRCEGHCAEGPNIRIGGAVHKGVDPGVLQDLLVQHFGPEQET